MHDKLYRFIPQGAAECDLEVLDDDELRCRIASICSSKSCNFIALVQLAKLDPRRHFRHCNWSGVTFKNCDLSGFDFTGSNLSNCDFSDAKLSGAIFKDAIIEGSNLKEALSRESSDLGSDHLPETSSTRRSPQSFPGFVSKPWETPSTPVSRTLSVFAPQSLEKFDRATRRQGRPDLQAPWRRFIVFGGTLGITAYLVRELYLVLSVGSIAGLEVALLLLFTINIFWLALAFMTALSGFMVIALRMRRSLVRAKDYDISAPLSGKTAIIICTYNEAPARIFGLAVATMRSLDKLGKVENFDLFILSDTTDPDTWVHEEAVFQAVREREDMGSRIFYRRRSANTGKKAGNVADWCRRWGANYEYMLVLDADSLMSGESLVRLAAIIEKNPDFGLVQTVPISIGRNTLFGRLQQFAGRFTARCWRRGSRSGTGATAISGGITPSSGPAPS